MYPLVQVGILQLTRIQREREKKVVINTIIRHESGEEEGA